MKHNEDTKVKIPAILHLVRKVEDAAEMVDELMVAEPSVGYEES